MFGTGIGDLNVYVRAGGEDNKVWGLSGDSGNTWYMAQAPIASPETFNVNKQATQKYGVILNHWLFVDRVRGRGGQEQSGQHRHRRREHRARSLSK